MGAPPSKGQDWLASTNVGGTNGGGASGGVEGGGLTGTAPANVAPAPADINSLIRQLQTAVAALQTALEGSGLLGTPPVTGGGSGTGAPSSCGCGGSMVQQSPEQIGGAAGGVEAAKADKVKKPKKPSQNGGSESTSQAAQGASGPGAAPSGFKIVNPLEGARVSSDFGPRASGNHSGYDLAKAQGSTIVAAAPGKVVKNVSLKDSYGNYIDIDHGNGWVTRYAHMVSKSPIPVGTTVNAGQPIGKVGSTGNSTGPHLHFEVIKNGAKLDPEPFLSGAKTF